MKFIRFILFNGLTRTILRFDFGGKENMTPDRVKAFMVEGLYIFIVFFPFIMLTAFAGGAARQMLDGQVSETGARLYNIIMLLPLYGFCIMALNKDFYNGQSIVNRHWGYKVIDIKTGEAPDRLKCLLRNLTAPILPFELPFVLLNQERRLGDFIAGTKLIRVEKTDPELILNEIEKTDFGQKTKLVLTIPTLIFILWIIWITSNL